jgi:Glycoside hydrolase family 44/Fibronectin type III domain
MKKGSFSSFFGSVLIVLLTLFFAACGGGSGSGGNGGGGGGGNPPAPPTGLTATAGAAQVALSWTASSAATSYHVKRSTVSGGPYTQVAAPAASSYTDTSLTNGTTYYYVVSAVNSNGESANSSQASATPSAPTTAVNVSVDVMTNRHFISPYVYGGSFPKDAATIADSGLTVVRWGGNASSTYNWQLGTDNADNDYYFEDFNFGALNNAADSNSTQFITDVKSAGSNPLMTMVMMDWVAKSAETPGPSGNLHWSFSVSKYGQQCGVDPYNSDAGNGIVAGTCNNNSPTYLTADPNDAYYPLLDSSSQSCPPWATAGCANAVYRNTWAAALARAFWSTASCPIPYSTLSSCHFYDMDNEIDIWGGTHFDIHPSPAGYDELRDVYLTQARNLKGWDPAAVRLGPVSCCWWFYWNGANGSDKGAHAGVDFLPWWLNEVYWQDQIAGSRSLDVFDIHAYPDGPGMSTWTTAQKRAQAVSIYRDYWDPTLVSPSGTINQTYTTNIEPDKTIAFRIPRMRAIVNSIYPGTPLAFTEWSAAFAGEADFSTALGDADAYGILGRERVSLATRWGAPDPANPNYQALKLYTNYDGSHHLFDPISVSATNDADPSLFSVYAAINAAGNSMTVMVLNKDPNNAAQTSFSFNGFTPSQVTAYTLRQSSPNGIVAGSSQAWSSPMTFQPYTATLLVITGNSTPPASEWDLNPDATMAPANGSATLAPKLTSGNTTLTLNTAVFDSYEGAAACNSGSISLTNPTVASGAPGKITLNAPASPGFCHFSVTASNGTTQGGWLVVGNPPASLAKTAGDGQTGSVGTQLSQALTVTLNAGQSGGSAAGASVYFTTSAGSLTNVQVGSEKVFTGSKVIAVTNSSGVASVKLTLPGTAGAVTVTAEGPYGLGHPVIAAPFSETAQ